MNGSTTRFGIATAVLFAVYTALDSIARANRNEVHAVTIGVNGTNLPTGEIKGSVTLNNRSRRPFTVSNGVLKFAGKTVAVTTL